MLGLGLFLVLGQTAMEFFLELVISNLAQDVLVFGILEFEFVVAMGADDFHIDPPGLG